MSDSRPALSTLPSSTRRVKIFGERNTGSGYLERLLLRNLEIECLRGGLPSPLRKLFPKSERIRDAFFRATKKRNLGWKHAFPPSREALRAAAGEATPVLFITLTKNPYAWLLSLYRRPYHAHRVYSSFSQFLAEPWTTVARENAPATIANPVELWNQKNASYLALGGYANCVLCRYEDLVDDPKGFLETLCREQGLARYEQPFENVNEATKGTDRGTTFDDYRDYYLRERWKADLCEEDIRRINHGLDDEVMSQLRYPRIEPGQQQTRDP